MGRDLLGRSVAFAGGWSGEAAGRREERGRKGRFQWWDIFFVGFVFCIKRPSCWCFMFSLPLCALCLTLLSFLLWETVLTEWKSCTARIIRGTVSLKLMKVMGREGRARVSFDSCS
jgi:hypothetical protein